MYSGQLARVGSLMISVLSLLFTGVVAGVVTGVIEIEEVGGTGVGVVGDGGGNDVGAFDASVETTVARRLERRVDDEDGISSKNPNNVNRPKLDNTCFNFKTVSRLLEIN